jgi:RNA polymerase sigma-70 factor (ECF subfamily)
MENARIAKPNVGGDPATFMPFPTTHWSLVARAGGGSLCERQRALADVLHGYMPALRAHLVFRRSLDRDRAEDVLQSFLTERVLEHEILSKADQQRGKFRTFLLTALDNFLWNEQRAARAAKRGPTAPMALDGEEALQVADEALTPDRRVEVAWARELLHEAVEQMRQHCLAIGRHDLWGVFEGRVLRATLGQGDAVSYDELVSRYHFASPSQASNVLVTANRSFIRILRGIIGRYEPDDEAIDAEVEELRNALAQSGGQ